MWENKLDRYINKVIGIPEDIMMGRPMRLSRNKARQKIGELLYLRHNINLYSDLESTPDFYWDRPSQEVIFSNMGALFDTKSRIEAINTKLNYSQELAEFLNSHLSERHSIRLEWCIIALISVEVVFEAVHYIDRFFNSGVA